MALDTIEGIKEYRDQVDQAATDNVVVIGMAPATMLTLLDTLLGVIAEQDRLLAGGSSNKLESAEIVPLHQARKVKPHLTQAPDLE